MSDRTVAREISYATSGSTRSGRAVIRVMENASGRLRLIRRVKGYEHEVAGGADFWEVMAQRYKIGLDVIGGSLENIPKEGPVVVVANHPFGILDGLTLGRILSSRRDGDFRILAHRVFRKAADLEKIILPISFDETKEAARLNMETRAEAVRYLQAGGAMGVFPGGTVSTAAKPFAPPMDPNWRTFTARMILKTGATVVPLFFDGANSRLFQLASHLHYTLRMGMLVREFGAKTGQPVRVVVGNPIDPAEIASHKSDSKQLMEFLRRKTYELSPRPLDPDQKGHEFEDTWKDRYSGSRNI